MNCLWAQLQASNEAKSNMEEYLAVDQQIETGGALSLAEIAEDVANKDLEQTEEDSDSEVVELEDEEAPVTAQEAGQAMRVLCRYADFVTAPATLKLFDQLDDAIVKERSNNMKQKTIEIFPPVRSLAGSAVRAMSTTTTTNTTHQSAVQEVPQSFSHPPGFSPNTTGSRGNNMAGSSASRPKHSSANPRHRHRKGPAHGSGTSQPSNYCNRNQKVANDSASGAPPPGFEPPTATVNAPDISSSSGSRPAHTEAASPKRSPNRTAGPSQPQTNEINRREHGREAGSKQKRFDREGAGNHPMHNSATNNYNSNSANSFPRSAGGGYRPRNARNRIDHAGVRMTGSTKNCLICCQQSDLFGIGSCLHPMCMECAIRVRILGESQACPQCRMQIDTLHFVQSPPFSGDFKVPKETLTFNDAQNYGVKFETEYALECFKSYMSHKCSICCSRGEEMSFANFSGLHQHMSNVHQLSFCYLCSENVNVLTKDRKTYTKNNLLKHMNGEGDQLEDGFHGHPKCLFCDQRFYDDEGQYKHLRKDHYFCQICDADGANNVFYKNHYELTRHYKRTHIPCVNRDCEAMGIVFRTQMELNVHKAKQHSGQTTGERLIQLDFQYTRNSAPTSRGQSSGQHQDQQMHFVPTAPENMTIVPSAQSGRHPFRIIRSAYNTQSSADFPFLETNIPPYGAPPNWRSSTNSQSAKAPRSQAAQVPLQSGEQFPSLSGGPSTNSGPSETAKQQSVWDKGNTKELFNAAATARAAQAAERAKRRPVIPMPDIWPEGMQEKLRARELGLPDPTEKNEVPMTEVVSESKKTKKKKSKTVPVNTVTVKDTGDFVPSSSKFELLSVFDEASEMGSGNNWWNKASAAKKTVSSREETQNIPILKPTSDDFVSIEMPGNSDGGSDSKPMTLRSIAMGIDHSKRVKEEIQSNSEQQISQDNDSLPHLYRLVSTVLSIQFANAFVERVFSLCKAQWTDARNSLQVETVKALLQVRVNYDIYCADVYQLLMNNRELRNKIQGGEKWE